MSDTTHEHQTGGVSPAARLLCGASHNATPQRQSGAERLAGGSAEHAGALQPFQPVPLDQYLIGACAAKQAVLIAQDRQARDDGAITCGCGWVRWIGFAYRCLYCGEWFCGPCAETHFGKTIDEWTIEKRIAKRLEIQARINSRSVGAERAWSHASDDSPAPPHNATNSAAGHQTK